MPLPKSRNFEIATECLHDAGFSDPEIENSAPLLFGPDGNPLGIEISHDPNAEPPQILGESENEFAPEIEKLLLFHDALLIHGVRAEVYGNVIDTLTSLRSLMYHGDDIGGCRLFWSPLGASRESHLLAETDTAWNALSSIPQVKNDSVFQEIMEKEGVANWIRMVRYASRRQDCPEHSATVLQRINAILGDGQYKEVEYVSESNQILILRLRPGSLVHGKIPHMKEDPDGPFFAQDFIA